MDDKEELDEVIISCKTVGDAMWQNGTGVAEPENFKQQLRYDFDKKRISLEFDSYEELVQANGTHGLKITLIDKGFEEKEYGMIITFLK